MTGVGGRPPPPTLPHMAAVTTLLCLLQTRQEFLAYYCPIQCDIDTVQTGGAEQAAAGFWGSDFATDYVSECLCVAEESICPNPF